MSMVIRSQEDLCKASRHFWAEISGMMIKNGREKKGLSIDQAACLAGIAPAAWGVCEAGGVPETVEQLRAMSGALGFSGAQMRTLAVFCREGWEG